MWLVQIFLPFSAGSQGALQDIKEELTNRFGGVTAYNRAPAEGVWRDGNKKEKDDIVIVEVMTNELDRAYWSDLRNRLEHQLNQHEIVVRASGIDRL